MTTLEQEETRSVNRNDVIWTIFGVVGTIWFIVDLFGKLTGR